MCEQCNARDPSEATPWSRRQFLRAAGATAAGLALARPGFAKSVPKPGNVLTPDESLARLQAGNARYVEGVARRHDFRAEREALAQGQNPFAAVLGCADSRIAPEYAFDTGRGDLFVVRVAGNFATDDGIASLEYAVDVLKTPLIVVLGHESCGAVSATMKSLKDKTTLPGHLPALVAGLTPAVNAAAGQAGDPLANAIAENVRLTAATLRGTTPILNGYVAGGRVRVVGGIYRLDTGKVDFIA